MLTKMIPKKKGKGKREERKGKKSFVTQAKKNALFIYLYKKELFYAFDHED